MRIVLDTNVVLDLVVFRDPDAGPLRQAIESGRIALLTGTQCLAEFRRVLAYPEFRLDDAAQAGAYAWYASRAETVATDPSPPFLPRCRDVDDQKFLELAWTSRAEHLVTKDRALLELARRVAQLGRFTLTTPIALTLPSE